MSCSIYIGVAGMQSTILSDLKAPVLSDSVQRALWTCVFWLSASLLSFLTFAGTDSAWGPVSCLISYPTELSKFLFRHSMLVLPTRLDLPDCPGFLSNKEGKYN